MTSRLLFAGATGVLVASTATAAALLDAQSAAPAVAKPPRAVSAPSPTPAVPAVDAAAGQAPVAPAVAPTRDTVIDLDAILADVGRAVEQAVDSARIGEQVDAALADVDVDGIVAEAMQSVQAVLPGTPRLGVSIRDLTSEEASAAGLPGIAGAWITDVREGSPAAAAGLATGDVVVRADGQDIRGARHLTRVVSETPEGRALSIEYQRGGARQTATVTPERGGMTMALPTPRGERAPRPFAYRMPMPPAMATMMPRTRLGASVQDLAGQLAGYFGVEDGVLVTSVTEGSAAARAGLQAGDVIVKAGETEVDGVRDLMRALAGVDSGSSLELQVSRNRATVTVSVTPDTRPTRNRAVVRTRSRTAAE